MIKLINRSGKFKRQLKENEREALEAMGKFGVKMMDKHVAVDTGLLMSRNTYVISANELYLMNDCLYAIFQEFGTYKMKAHPFMRPAAGYTAQYSQIAALYLAKGM
jgi:HK97 gp10 family phage protein